MRTEERKKIELETYSGKLSHRPAFSDFFDWPLFERMRSCEMIVDQIANAERYLRDKEILILGAGSSDVSFVYSFSKEITALNLAEAELKGIPEAFPEVKCVVYDAEDIDRLNQHFDAVYCHAILHHLHPLEIILEKISRVLRADGVLFVANEPGFYNPFAIFGRLFTPSAQHTPGEVALRFFQFRRLASRYFHRRFEKQYFLFSMMLPVLSKKIPFLRRLLSAASIPFLGMEKILRHIPGLTLFYWLMAGIYEKK